MSSPVFYELRLGLVRASTKWPAVSKVPGKDWTLPWAPTGAPDPRKKQDHLWLHYLRKSPDPSSDASRKAYVVPLRRKVPANLSVILPHTRVECKAIFGGAFAYPHGIAVDLELRLAWPQGASETLVMGDLLRILDASWTATLDGGAPQRGERLENLADALLEWGWHDAGYAEPCDAPDDVMHVATVVKAEWEGSAPLEKDQDVWSFLWGLASLNPDWNRQPQYPKPAEVNLMYAQRNERLQRRDSSRSIVYRAARGRAVWMPGLFTSTEGQTRRLGCYHRNLTVLMLHTGILSRAVELYLEARAQGTAPSELADLARNAALRLSELCAADKSLTYASASPRAYLEDNVLVERVNAVLTESAKPLLSELPVLQP
jgi:hypothetical protein